MCGIIGIIGREPVAPLLVDALKRLEYRGYDSAGVATLEQGVLTRRRAEGKLRNLEQKLARDPLEGSIGIGHTRWATHGRPNETNAHPHATERLAVVHNGIIENFSELRRELEAKGAKFTTETDSEVIAHLVTDEIKQGRSPVEAVDASLPRLRGAFALAFLFTGEDDLLIGARKGSPLAIGFGDDAMYIGSDAIALAPFTDTVSYLEDGDCAVIHRDSAEIHDAAGHRRAPRRAQVASVGDADRQGQPPPFHGQGNSRAAGSRRPYAGALSRHGGRTRRAADGAAVRFPRAQAHLDRRLRHRLLCRHGRAVLVRAVRAFAGRCRYRLGVSLSRCTARSRLACRSSSRSPARPPTRWRRCAMRAKTASTFSRSSMCRRSTIARESDIVMPTLAGPEIGVASTKAFTCQLAALAALAIAAGRARGVLSESDEKRLVRALIEVPRHMTEVLALEPQIEQLARDQLAKARDVLYLGRGTSYPIALEGALKLKEISYIHAEGYAAGELKHGPIALIDETMPVVVIAPYDRVFEKTVSNMQEVAARGGRLILVTDAKGAAAAEGQALVTLTLPTMPSVVGPLVYAVPVQLIAYHTAVALGTDVDQPRNLAKSVTVE